MRRLFAALLTALPLALTPAAAQDALRARFDARVSRIPDDPDGRAGRGLYPRLWSTMDSLVVRELDRGRSPDEVNAFLATLRGFESPTPGKSVTIGRGRFVSQMPREVPSYFVAPVRARGQPLLLGVYQYGTNEAGRVTVYARRGAAWAATDRLDTRWPAEAYLLPLGDSGLAVVTFESFTGGDHVDGRVRIWSLEDGRLSLRDSLPGEMKDPQARTARDTVEFFFTRYPRHIRTPIMGVRIEHYVVLTVDGTRVRRSHVLGNPWVEVLDRYYALRELHHPREAARLLASPALARELGRGDQGIEDHGDLAGGHGEVVVGQRDRAVAVRSVRGRDGVWRIAAIRRVADPRER